MNARTLLAALLASMFVAAAAYAQTAAPDEFSRVSGGELEFVAKRPRSFSGSFGISLGGGSQFGLGGRGYNASVGGTAIEDRLWFFASAERMNNAVSSRFAQPLVQSTSSNMIDAKLNAQLGDRQTLAASLSSGKTLATFPGAQTLTIPQSFLSLHYTAMVSSNMMVSASVSQQNTSVR